MFLAMNTIAHASPMSAGGPQLDNRRVAAGLIDLLVVLAGAFVIGFAAGLTGTEYRDAGLAMSAVIAAWALYYYFACESGGGQTLGKRVMKIRVVRVDGSPAGMRDIAVRTVLRIVDGLFLYLVGLIVMLVSGERRGRLGDLAAGTMIVSADAARATPFAEVASGLGSTTVTVPSRGPEPVEPIEPAVAVPEVASTELKDLARDIAAEPAAEAEPEVEPEPFVAPPYTAVPIAATREDSEDAGAPVVVNSDETVSAIDLIMEDEPAEDHPTPPA